MNTATTTPNMALAVGQFVDVDSEETEIVAISGRWVKLENGQSISRATALEFRCEEEEEDDQAEADEEEEVTGYQGSMLRLRERMAEGAYQKAVNGQPCCGDRIATLLGSLAPAQVIQACIIAMALPSNPYSHLNVGQQSMNLRNKLRGCFKREEFGFGVLVEAVEQIQDAMTAA